MEVVSVHLGQAGVQVGDLCWAQFCLEHGISDSGKADMSNEDNTSDASLTTLRSNYQSGLPQDKSYLSLLSTDQPGKKTGEGFNSFFQELSNGNFTPRGLFIDLEPSVVDEVYAGKRKQLYSPGFLVRGSEDAANNFARGYYSTGRVMLPMVLNPLRKCVEACDRLQGFIMYHSFGGGTGSGFNALVSQEISTEYSKSSKLELAIFPSPKLSTAVVEPYNAILNTHHTLENTECVFLTDNEAMYNICQKQLEIDSPTYKNLNRLIAMALSSITSSLRFKGSLNTDFTDFQTNLVPFPRIHFPIMSFAPITSEKRINHETLSVADLTIQVFTPQCRLAVCDNESGQYIACCLLYRGDVTPKDVNSAISLIKGRKRVAFVDWCPTGFKVGINHKVSDKFPDSNIAAPRKTVCMICNTSAIQKAWESLNIKFHAMLQKKAFMHWYVSEGMEAEEFVQALSNCLALENDYKEIN